MEVWKNENKHELHQFFCDVYNSDPSHFDYDYLLGDLDDFFFKHCTWFVLRDCKKIEEIVLVYHVDMAHPTILAFAKDRDNVDKLLRLLELSKNVWPSSFYCHYLTNIEHIFTNSYTLEKNYGVHYKMKFTEFSRYAVSLDTSCVSRLSVDDKDEILQFYQESYPENWFSERMLLTNKYFGVREIHEGKPKLVCVCGVHVYSEVYNICTLGNIATHPNFRGKGYATKSVVQLIRDVLQNTSITYIGLNVGEVNVPARKCYERIGFVKTCEFVESLFISK